MGTWSQLCTQIENHPPGNPSLKIASNFFHGPIIGRLRQAISSLTVRRLILDLRIHNPVRIITCPCEMLKLVLQLTSIRTLHIVANMSIEWCAECWINCNIVNDTLRCVRVTDSEYGIDGIENLLECCIGLKLFGYNSESTQKRYRLTTLMLGIRQIASLRGIELKQITEMGAVQMPYITQLAIWTRPTEASPEIVDFLKINSQIFSLTLVYEDFQENAVNGFNLLSIIECTSVQKLCLVAKHGRIREIFRYLSTASIFREIQIGWRLPDDGSQITWLVSNNLAEILV